MNFKNGFKLGMAIASPIVLMSTYAAPCFAASSTVVTDLTATDKFITLDTEPKASDKFCFYNGSEYVDLDLDTGSVDVDGDYIIEAESKDLTFSPDGLKKIYGDTNASSIAEDKDVKIYKKIADNVYTPVGMLTFRKTGTEAKQYYYLNFDLGYTNAPKMASQLLLTTEKTSQPSDPTRTGYTFDGWYTKDEKDNWSSSAYYFETPVRRNITLYAKWKPNVTFDYNYTGAPEATVTSVESGSIVTKPSDPTRTDYTFDGWYKEAACTTAWDFTNGKVEAATTLYAKWIQIPVLEVSDFEQENVALNFIESYEYKAGDEFKFGGTLLGKNDIELVPDSRDKNKIIGIEFTADGLRKIYGDANAEAILENKVVDIKAVRNSVEQIIGRVSFKATDTTDTDKDDDNNSTGSSSSDSEGNSNGSSSNAGSSSSKTSGTKRGSGTRTGEAFMGLQGLAAMISAGLGLFISKRRKK